MDDSFLCYDFLTSSADALLFSILPVTVDFWTDLVMLLGNLTFLRSAQIFCRVILKQCTNALSLSVMIFRHIPRCFMVLLLPLVENWWFRVPLVKVPWINWENNVPWKVLKHLPPFVSPWGLLLFGLSRVRRWLSRRKNVSCNFPMLIYKLWEIGIPHRVLLVTIPKASANS